MRILKFLSRFLICILCIGALCTSTYADKIDTTAVQVDEFGELINQENIDTVVENMKSEATEFQQKFTANLHSSDFVPIEVRIGLMLMKALSSMDYVLHLSLVRFTIIFLLIMYAFWVMMEAYRMIKRGLPYKEELFYIFKQGIVVIIWLVVLDYGTEKLFADIISPVLALGSRFSDFILDAVADTQGVRISDTCTAIQNYVSQNGTTLVANNEHVKLLLDAKASANIMCLPSHLSVYFYDATGTAFKWFIWGFGHSATAIFMGGICVFIFIKCIFKYAFMTLGVVTDLFLTLLMLPFTALAEALPPNAEKGYVGKILNGFLSIFNTKKLSGVLSVFINAAIYFISLAIIIAICSSLLNYLMPTGGDPDYSTRTAMVNILCASLILYLAGKAEELAKTVGGSINNSFGEKIQGDAKTLWGDAKGIAGKIFKDWIKK